MQCLEGSTKENLPPYFLVPEGSLPLGTMEKVSQDPWQGRGRPWQVLWLRSSLICMLEPLPFDSLFILGSLYKPESLTLEYLLSCAALPSAVQLSCHLLPLLLILK